MASQNPVTYQRPVQRDWSTEITPLPGQTSVMEDGGARSGTGHAGNHARHARDGAMGNHAGGARMETAEQTAAEWMRTLPAAAEAPAGNALSNGVQPGLSNSVQPGFSNGIGPGNGLSNGIQPGLSNGIGPGNTLSGNTTDRWADKIGSEIENHLPDDMIEAPTTLEEVYRGSIKSLLLRNLGNYVVATFLIGTQGTVSWEGILYDVGNDYVAIYQSGRDQYIVCDLYSLKYVEFYDTQRRALCDAVLAEREENGLRGASA